MTYIRVLAGFLATSALTSVHAQDPTAEGVAAAVCARCHGSDGNSTSPSYPKLAGQHSEYLLAQFKAFRDRSRKDPDAHTDMWAISARLDDQMMLRLADYFSAQQPARGQPGDAQLSALGKVIYERGIRDKDVPACAFCHGDRAQGIAVFPRLAGQHAEYVVKQIKVFHTDDRPNLAVTMKAVVQRLSDTEAEQVAAYLQGL